MLKVGIIRCQQTEDMCPGKRAIARAKLMIDRGAEAIIFGSCISKGNPIGYPCPNFQKIKESIIKKFGPDIKIIEWTH
jgi:predicted metal-binding protein